MSVQPIDSPTSELTPSATPEVRSRLPRWAAYSVAINGLLLLGLSVVAWKPQLLGWVTPQSAPSIEATAPMTEATPVQVRRQLSYEQWLTVLKQEADTIAQTPPPRLSVLLGDSLSLWFPVELLPSDQVWLNQGISGENSAGLLKRLNLFEKTNPETVWLMIGVNDLQKGITSAQVLDNLKQTIEALKAQHPETQVVVQSLLPHGGERSTVEDRAALLQLPNERVFQFNQQLAELARSQQSLFLDLYPLFADADGLLRSELTTDGLHLNQAGYLVWRSALQVFAQTQLKPLETAAAAPELPSETPVDATIATPDATPEPTTPATLE